MPKCRNCGTRITKFDKDICPVCGCKNPLDGVESETVEITSQFKFNENDINKKDLPRSRKTALILFLSAGFTGAGFFYLRNKKLGLVWLITNLLILLAISLGLYFVKPINLFSILIGLAACYLINIVTGLIIYSNVNYRDGQGELLR